MPQALNNLSASGSQPGNLTILVSPDQEDYRSFTNILESNQWSVRGARSFREALQFLSDLQQPAVVACERELPDGDWKDVYQFMESLRNPPPLVVVSRHADESFWAEVLNVGGYDVLAKPFEEGEVQRVMTMARRFGAGEQRAKTQ